MKSNCKKIFLIHTVWIAVLLLSVQSCVFHPKHTPIIYIKTSDAPVSYVNYYISEKSVIKVVEEKGKKSRSEFDITKDQFDGLVQTLKKKKFASIKEGFQKKIGTEGIRIISNIPEIHASKSNAGGILLSDQNNWNEIVQALEAVVNSHQ